MKPISHVLAAWGLSALAAAAGAEVITNSAPPDGFAPVPSPWTAAFGQTFTVGADRYLTSFNVALLSNAHAFKAYVYAWDGSRPTGEQLYASSPYSNTADNWTTVSFDTGGIALVAGQQYVAFLSSIELGSPEDWVRAVARTSFDSLAGGGFVSMTQAGSFGALFGSAWYSDSEAGDLSFTAVLAAQAPQAVPEPASLVLVALALGGAAFARRRKDA